MTSFVRSALLLLALTPALLAAPGENCGCACCKDKPKGEACCCNAPAATAPDVKRHALRGVVTRVDVERSAMMVKHEEIPGVMRAMTMLFKVDTETLRAVKAGDTITALMSRQQDEWVLENVKVAPRKAN